MVLRWPVFGSGPGFLNYFFHLATLAGVYQAEGYFLSGDGGFYPGRDDRTVRGGQPRHARAQ
jgi:hypothetical protein